METTRDGENRILSQSASFENYSLVHSNVCEKTNENSSNVLVSSVSHKLSNPFDRLRPLDLKNELNNDWFLKPNEPSKSLFNRPLKSSLEQMQVELDEQQKDSSLSTAHSSVHLPVEKQRGISEVIRKRNSRFKVEDYKRSFHRSNTFDEPTNDFFRPAFTSKLNQTDFGKSVDCLFQSNSKFETSKSCNERLTKTKSVEIPIDVEVEEKFDPCLIQRSSEQVDQLIHKSNE